MRVRPFNPAQGSHNVYLIEWVNKTKGPVLELGMGCSSTFLLHELCRERRLVSMENDPNWFNLFSRFGSPWHELKLVESWDKADVEQPWSLVLLDLTPGEERKVVLERLRNWADYILIHDTEMRANRHYHIRECFRSFKYRMSYKAWAPHTTVLSDRCEL